MGNIYLKSQDHLCHYQLHFRTRKVLGVCWHNHNKQNTIFTTGKQRQIFQMCYTNHKTIFFYGRTRTKIRCVLAQITINKGQGDKQFNASILHTLRITIAVPDTCNFHYSLLQFTTYKCAINKWILNTGFLYSIIELKDVSS